MYTIEKSQAHTAGHCTRFRLWLPVAAQKLLIGACTSRSFPCNLAARPVCAISRACAEVSKTASAWQGSNGLFTQVASCYPQQTAGFVQDIIGLLDRHYAVLNSSLRQTLAKSLILLRNRNQVSALELLPLFFRLFRCQDKSLRQLLFRHIIAGGSNAKPLNPYRPSILAVGLIQGSHVLRTFKPKVVHEGVPGLSKFAPCRRQGVQPEAQE